LEPLLLKKSSIALVKGKRAPSSDAGTLIVDRHMDDSRTCPYLPFCKKRAWAPESRDIGTLNKSFTFTLLRFCFQV
jgi:hypothetical protein